MPRTFVIAQGGGPTAVINQTVAGAVAGDQASRHPDATVLGARHGVRGIRDGDYVDFAEVAPERLQLIAGTPSAALGSTRDKPDAAYCDVVLKGLKKVGADAFIYIGGNDTAGTQQILADAAGGKIAFVHAPKTIDNDLVENDHTPGFISAARVRRRRLPQRRSRFPGAARRLCRHRHGPSCRLPHRRVRGLARGRRRRPASALRARSGRSRCSASSTMSRKTLDRHKRCIVAVSEGVSTEDGKALVESLVPPDKLERDAHGNVKLSGSDLPMALSSGRWPKACPASAPASMRWATCRAAISAPSARSMPGKPSTPACSRSTPPTRAAARSRFRTRQARRCCARCRWRRRRQDPAHAGRLPAGRPQPAVGAGMAYLKRLVPKKFEVGQAVRLRAGRPTRPPAAARGRRRAPSRAHCWRRRCPPARPWRWA